MKLLLTSAGFTTEAINRAFIDLCGKPKREISVAVINEAYAAEEGDKRWVIDELSKVASSFPAEIDLVNLLALTSNQVKDRIEPKDAIFVMGGHTDYLMSVFNKSGFSKLLQDLLETKVYVGSSAGSMVIGNRISSEAYNRVYGEKNDYGVNSYMGLVNFAMKPHFGSPLWPNNRKEVLEDISKDIKGTVYGLRDDDAIVIRGSDITTVGEPLTIIDGKAQ